MRATSESYRAKVGYLNRWQSVVTWSNDGWRTSNTATYVSGTCTASLLLQTHWTCDLVLTDATVGLDGINGYSTQLLIMHGMVGEPLLAMGLYKVNTAEWSRDNQDQIHVTGSSLEWYIQGSRFISARTFKRQAASTLTRTLLQEVIPGVSLSWEVDDLTLPGMTEERDRWALLDGTDDSPSVAKAVGGYLMAGPAGGFVMREIPTLNDDAVWEASEGEGGVLITYGESFTDEGVYNTIVYNGESTDTDTLPFPPGVAQDLDPLSPTYVLKPVTQGGFGVVPRFYTSQFLTSTAQAQKAAEAALAPYLGLRTQVDFTQLHDPSLEPGDVGIVHTVKGDRRVLLDEITYDLAAAPLSATTRTTATTLVGNAYVAPDDSDTGA